MEKSKFRTMIKDNGRKNLVLLCGFMKTGNTWTRIFIVNYFNILNFNANECMFPGKAVRICHKNVNNIINGKEKLEFDDGFPSLLQTHNSRFKTKQQQKFFESFEKMVYIYRNPFDTMISLFHHRNKDKRKFMYENLNRLKEFENSVYRELPKYAKHVKENTPYANEILNYSQLRKDPNEFKKLLYLLVEEIDEDVFERAVKMSSFESVNEIFKRKKDQRKYRITRNGHIGQYKKEMSEKLIDWIKDYWKQEELRYDYGIKKRV